MNADDFNAQQLSLGRLTYAHVTELVKAWQASRGLEVDGRAGPATIATLGAAPAPSPAHLPPKLSLPLPVLPDGRAPVITSEFRPPDRPKHDGVDLFYRWRAGDKPDFAGDHGAAGKNPDGTPKWVVPYECLAIAAAAGKVHSAADSGTGHYCWIDHGNGWRTGYFHLIDLRVAVGERVEVGHPIGLVGDNPADNDARHLHFELSPVDRYDPVDPAPHLG